MKHIGIVAVSAEGAALCYRTICLEGAGLLGPCTHPEVSLHCFPLSSYQHLIDCGRWDAVGEQLLESAARLVRAGAELLICPDNTVHQGLDLVRARSPIPWIHIAEEVIAEARRRSLQRLAILGTRFLMEGPVYPSKLKPAGIDYRIPDAQQRQRINQIIYDQLVYARILPESLAYFQDVIRDLAAKGCDGVALACTEIPLLIGEAESPLPILDSTRILARAALRQATADEKKSSG
jgi:aspartate racemase